MKLFEYQAQKLLNDFDIPSPGGKVATTAEEAVEIMQKTGDRAVIKAQVLTGGRGKAGGIAVVSSAEEARSAAERILKMSIRDNPVHKVFVTPTIDVKRELYTSILVNSGEKTIECMICAEGGIEIEEIAATSPEKIHRIPLSSEVFIEDRIIMERLGKIFNAGLAMKMRPLIEKMFNLFVENDCSLFEINPLAIDQNGGLTALDAKIVIDDNALFKHPGLEEMKNPEEYSQDEIDARKASLAFVSLDGRIGCMVNGAGLAMATMDLIKYFGGEPANFLDIGGSSNPGKVVDGLNILLRNKNIKAILLNIFGGITRCDDIAKGLVEAEKEFHIKLPLVIRLIGTNDMEGIAILKKNGFNAFSDLAEAVKSVVSKVH